jgi:hypothetical protein
MDNAPAPLSGEPPPQLQHTKGNDIKSLYENLSYLDSYGSQVLGVIVIIFAGLLITSFAYVKSHMDAIKSDWANQRCNPTVMPFAGFINKSDPNMTINEATRQNFEYCNQNTLKEISADALQPITFALNNLNTIAGQTGDTINSSRGMFDKMRTGLQSTTQALMGRLLNITVPLQMMVIAFKDMMGKVQGVMTTALFTSLGSYYTLKATLGAMADLMTKTLIALSAAILIMWLSPFTWGVASAMTAVFISVSIPLALMLSFMANTLHIKTGLKLPHAPKRPACFDELTPLAIRDDRDRDRGGTGTLGTTIKLVPIKNIQVGDILAADGARVTAKMRLMGHSNMYDLEGVIVSGTHLVYHQSREHNHKNKWIPVSEHPRARHLPHYAKKTIYCLNTTSKRMVVLGQIFSDWDELVTDKQRTVFTEMCNVAGLHKPDDMPLGVFTHSYLDKGFNGDVHVLQPMGFQKPISQINIGDYVKMDRGNTVVYGIVQISNPCDEHDKTLLWHLLTEDDCFMVRGGATNPNVKNTNSDTPDTDTDTESDQDAADNSIEKLYRDYNDCIDAIIQG